MKKSKSNQLAKRIIISISTIALIVAIAYLFNSQNEKNDQSKVADANTIKRMQNQLGSFATETRYIGTKGSENAQKYISGKMRSFGYEVTEQDFKFAKQEALTPNQITNKGTNVIATKKSNKPNADILIVSAHYDTVATTIGANDDASGIVTILELARALKNTKSDTEIRFIAFDGEEEGLLGSSFYVKSLSDSEKQRVIGAISIDMLGHYLENKVLIAGANNADTLIGNLIKENADKLSYKNFIREVDPASDHMSFVSGGIPAIMLAQKRVGPEYHTAADCISIVDMKKVLPVVKVLQSTLGQVMDSSTTKLAKRAYEITNMKNPSYTISDETVLFFDEKKSLNDSRVGGPGKFIKTYTDTSIDWKYNDYLYNAKWFGLSKVIPTTFQYRDTGGHEYLTSVSLNYEEAGLTEKELKDVLTKKYGKPEYDAWVDTLSSRQYMFYKTESGKMEIFISGNYSQMGKELAKYDLTKGIKRYKGKIDKNQYKLLELSEKVFVQNKTIDAFSMWTDGYSHILGVSLPNNQNNKTFTMQLDVNDVFDNDGSYKNIDKTLATLVHEYGHTLTLNSTQVDHAKLDPDSVVTIPKAMLPNSYIGDFYNQFWKATANDYDLYRNHPDWFVDEYASQDVDEDIAESFMMFVLSDKQHSKALSGQKINFFYKYPELVEIRKEIRENLSMPSR